MRLGMASAADSIARGIGLDKILPPQEMLVKKMYGAVNTSEYSHYGVVVQIKKNQKGLYTN